MSSRHLLDPELAAGLEKLPAFDRIGALQDGFVADDADDIAGFVSSVPVCASS